MTRAREKLSLRLFSLLLAIGTVPQAQAGEPVGGSPPSLVFIGCDSFEASEVKRLVGIDGASMPESAKMGVALIVSCTGVSIEIRLERGAATPRTRSFDLAGAAKAARPRLIAIDIGELLSASTGDLGSLDPAESSVVPTVRDARTSLPPPAPPTLSRVEIVGTGRTLFGGVPRLLGAGVRVASDRAIPWSLDVLYEHGSPSTSEGGVSIHSLATGATVSVVAPMGEASARAGLGLRGGFAELTGRPSDPAHVQAASILRGWCGPMINAGVDLRLRRIIVLEVVLETGYFAFPVYGLVSGERQVSFGGVWLGAQMGLGIPF